MKQKHNFLNKSSDEPLKVYHSAHLLRSILCDFWKRFGFEQTGRLSSWQRIQLDTGKIRTKSISEYWISRRNMVDENQTAFPNATPKMVILFHGQEISIRF